MNRLVRTLRRLQNPAVLRRDLRLLWATARLRLFSRSDLRRWSDDREFDPQWDERAAIMARYIPPGSRVLELGAGRRSLERFLDPSCLYLPADLVSRGPDTIVFDLNRRPLPELAQYHADIAVFAGVLEYVRDVPSVIEWLSRHAPACLVSYQLAHSRPGTASRLRESARRAVIGWVNTYDRDELVAIFASFGYRCELEAVGETSLGGEPVILFRRGAGNSDELA